MELYVERQCVDQMKQGNIKQFLLLFDANFSDVYRYVFRRVGEGEEAERIVRLVFLDAIGQIQNTPTDISYSIWLYGLAKPRVWDQISRSSFPEKQGLISREEAGKEDLIGKAEKMFKKLSLEEREILRLKFFEEVADGDVMIILGVEDAAIGSKIYRVFKRAHFLLFGESDERQGVYFGELSSFLSRVREAEKVVIPEAFRLSLRADLSGRIDRREFAVEVEAVEESVPKEPPVKIMREDFVGSNDPAKIFVEAVKEMKEEEEMQRLKDQLELEREERVFDFFERWRRAFTIIPGVIFVGLVAIFLISFFDISIFGGGEIERGYPTGCKISVDFNGDFSDGEKRSVNEGVSDKICGHFDVSRLLITRLDNGKVKVDVDVSQWFLEYRFVKKVKDWRIKEYARTLSGHKKSGKV